MKVVKKITIPEFKELSQWFCWNYKYDEKGKKTKVPISYKKGKTGTDEAHRHTWTTFENAETAKSEYGFDGVGFAFDSGQGGIDIDKRDLDDPMTRDILSMFSETYAEISPSGKGFHVSFLVDLRKLPKDYKEKYYQKNVKLGIECYIGGITKRYFTYTGNIINDKPIIDCTEELLKFLNKYMLRRTKSTSTTHTDTEIKSTKYADSDICNNIIEIIKKSKQAEKFNKLYFEGDITDYDEDDSSADLALCDILAFYCGENFELIDTLFCKSKLYRTKWDRPDYKSSTITKAIESCDGKFYRKTIKEVSTIKSITAKELSLKKLPELYVVVKELLGQGLSVLAGQRKLGKSWMILYLCYCVCTGQPFLGFETIKSACWYLALEDSDRRLQERMEKLFGDKDVPENLHYSFYCESIDKGLIEQLEKKLLEYPDIKLIVIDTLQKVRGVKKNNQNDYDYDYKEVGKLKEFADKHNICILVVHHLRKMKDYSDPFNNVSGSVGITGAADTTIVLYKDDFKDTNAHFVTQSRDFEGIEKILFFNDCKWEVIGDSIDFDKEIEKLSYETDPIVITINKLLEESPEGVKIIATELLKKIIETTGIKPVDSPSALSKHIKNKLQFDLLAYGGIHYEPPPENGGSSGRKMFFCKINKDI